MFGKEGCKSRCRFCECNSEGLLSASLQDAKRSLIFSSAAPQLSLAQSNWSLKRMIISSPGRRSREGRSQSGTEICGLRGALQTAVAPGTMRQRAWPERAEKSAFISLNPAGTWKKCSQQKQRQQQRQLTTQQRQANTHV
ncbi:unnamed protein product [Pleuronectes platessa]|uniref:Uncharacterized protein n=1 Tax=Pleuronectes platessa TaxID=8262 RepID=A0A9N7UPS0_PLEPL|nr:unnamed protein product [Pleuronectes platessa]